MPKTLEPDMEFVERLEWQLASELRRSRLKRSAPRIAVPRAAVAAALLAGILLAGVAAIKAAELVQDSWRKKIEIARAETEVRLQEARLETERGQAALVHERYAVGLVSEGDDLLATTTQERSRLGLERSRLDLDEVRRSGAPPRDELYAPLVGGRDFVSERLQLERRGAELGLKVLAARAKQLEERQRLGLIAPGQARSAGSDIAARRTRIAEIGQRLDLRKRFLAAALSAVRVEIAGRLATAQANLAVARSKVEDLKERKARAETRRDLGVASPAEFEELADALGAAEAELKLAALEVGILEKVK